jgi:hypothetical protein
MQDPWSLEPWSAKHPLELAHDTTEPQDQNFMDDLASAENTVVKSVSEENTYAHSTDMVHSQTVDVEPWEFTEKEFVETKPRRNFKKYRQSTSKPTPKIQEKQKIEKKTPKQSKYIFKKKNNIHRVVCESNYDAIDDTGIFGLIYNNSTMGGYMSFTIHSKKKTPLFQPGDSLNIIKRDGGVGVVRFGFVGRSEYVQPGRPIRSMIVGVSAENWKRLTNEAL